MRVLRVESPRVQAWATRGAQAVWNAFDVQLVVYALLLAIIGLVVAYSNSAAGGSPLAVGSVFGRGLIWLAIAIVAFTVAASIDYRWLKTFAWPVYFVNLGLLLVSLAFGTGVGGVARWVTIFGLQFQFSEIAKILMIVVLGNFLAQRQNRLNSVWTVAGACVLAAPPLILVLIQPDLGTSLVFGAILFGTLFIAGVGLRWLALLATAVEHVCWELLRTELVEHLEHLAGERQLPARAQRVEGALGLRDRVLVGVAGHREQDDLAPGDLSRGLGGAQELARPALGLAAVEVDRLWVAARLLLLSDPAGQAVASAAHGDLVEL